MDREEWMAIQNRRIGEIQSNVKTILKYVEASFFLGCIAAGYALYILRHLAK